MYLINWLFKNTIIQTALMKVEKIKQTQIIYNCIQSSYIYDSIKTVNLI